MIRYMVGLTLVFVFATPAYSKSPAEASLLNLCDSFGETLKECRCYMKEVKGVYTQSDIDLAGGVARAFMNGEEPEAIAVYILLTRKITISRANAIYKLGDKHIDRVAKSCEDKSQKITPEIKAKREAMRDRMEKIGARYRVGPRS